ncbi:MAG TPA: DUF3572 domain-containing protein [Rhodobiaceae bacterium]|nr:DUF3572 domain-containing protein [Rhodobiaceae bacterium]
MLTERRPIGRHFIARSGKHPNYSAMQEEEAEILALKALSYLAGLDEMMDRFADLSGMGPNDIMERAEDTEMLAGVLDFFLFDEALLTAFCEAHEINPEHPAQARMALPGGDLPHWT